MTEQDKIEPGVYYDLDNGVYHGGPGISNSGLGDVLQSPLHYWARHLDPNRPEREQTASQLDGHIAHCAILEPDEFHKRYMVGPNVNRNTKAWKEFCEINSDKEVIKPDQYTRAMRQRDSVWKIPEVAKALEKGRAEVSAYWVDEETGVLCRCRPDFVHEVDSSSVIEIDVKTYGNASPKEFERQVPRMNYHRQDAYYSDGYAQASGLEVLGFIFVSVEMTWPFAASATMLDDDSKASGRAQYRRALNIYAECCRTGEWPCYTNDITMIRLPDWAMETPL